MPQPEVIPIDFLKNKKALHQLHRLGVVHNDVKPNNIMWEGGPNGRGVVLIDFGSATVHPPNSFWAPKTQHLHITWPFAAPELRIPYHPRSHNVDIWSVGVMLFMMVSSSQSPPFSFFVILFSF